MPRAARSTSGSRGSGGLRLQTALEGLDALVVASFRPVATVVVDANGVAEGWVPGTASVRVTSGGVTAEAEVRVEATLASLRTLTDRAFTEGGITHHGMHAALIAKIEEAEGGEHGALQGYIHLLRAQRGKKVTEAWTDRLTANAEYIRVTRP